jgi:DNA adenine methylase
VSVQPPITWFGSKSRLAPKIVSQFAPHHTYCEPFGGSAAVLLAKPPAKVEVYNDINADLVNLFRVIREPDLFSRLRSAAENTLYARNEFKLAKEPSDDPVESARRFLVRQRQSHGGLGNNWSYCVTDSSGGMASAVKRWQTGLDRLPLVHKRLKTVQIEQADWRDIIDRFDNRNTLFYLDPPYVPGTRVNGKYAHELTQDHHHILVTRLLSLNGMAVLSGYQHESYKPLEEAGWSRIDHEVPAHTSDNRTRRIECLWLSPALIAAKQATGKAQDGELQSELFAARTESMRQGAYQTHKARVDATEARLLMVIQEMKNTGKRITKSSVAAAAQVSREHVVRKYAHLFAV